jgi:hypothetical protein
MILKNSQGNPCFKLIYVCRKDQNNKGWQRPV